MKFRWHVHERGEGYVLQKSRGIFYLKQIGNPISYSCVCLGPREIIAAQTRLLRTVLALDLIRLPLRKAINIALMPYDWDFIAFSGSSALPSPISRQFCSAGHLSESKSRKLMDKIGSFPSSRSSFRMQLEGTKPSDRVNRPWSERSNRNWLRFELTRTKSSWS